MGFRKYFPKYHKKFFIKISRKKKILRKKHFLTQNLYSTEQQKNGQTGPTDAAKGCTPPQGLGKKHL